MSLTVIQEAGSSDGDVGDNEGSARLVGQPSPARMPAVVSLALVPFAKMDGCVTC